MDSRRIGQMLFLLGLAHATDDRLDRANAVWERHFETYPADRFAMLSRFHHTSYAFSPHAGGQGGMVVGGSESKNLTPQEIEAYLERLSPRTEQPRTLEDQN